MPNFADKYDMPLESNVSFAKQHIADLIFKEIKIEHIGMTFPDTKLILEGSRAARVNEFEMVDTLNLKRAWQYNLETIKEPLTVEYLETLNLRVDFKHDNLAPPGKIRTWQVYIDGSKYLPPALPDRQEIADTLAKISATSQSATDAAIDTLLYILRQQPFGDGNKRTAQLAANHILIQNGKGILALPAYENEDVRKFLLMLVAYYDTGDKTEIKEYIYNNALLGVNFNGNVQSL